MSDKDTLFRNMASGFASLVKDLLTGKVTIRTVCYGVPTIYSPFALGMAAIYPESQYLWIASIGIVTFICMFAGELATKMTTGVDVTAEVKRWKEEEEADKYPCHEGVEYTDYRGLDVAKIFPEEWDYENKIVVVRFIPESGVLSVLRNGYIHPSCVYDYTNDKLVSLNTDPFGLIKTETTSDQYIAMTEAMLPYEYMTKKYGRVDIDMMIVFGVAKGIENYNKYLAGDETFVNYVNELLAKSIENLAKTTPKESQIQNCREIYATVFGFKV